MKGVIRINKIFDKSNNNSVYYLDGVKMAEFTSFTLAQVFEKNLPKNLKIENGNKSR